MAEKLKNKVTDEELKIRATSDEKITVKLTNNYAFQKIFKNAKIVKGFLMALLNLKEYEIKKIEIINANIRMYRNDHLKMYKITL